MAFFQTSVVNKYLNSQDKDIVKQAYEKFTAYFHNHEIQKNIRNAKEEQFQEGFLRELFVNVLGYTLNPNPEFNLTTEFKNEQGAKKADGAILYDSKALAVIELKGTNTTDLDKVAAQAFGYKNNQSSCIYIITSNFEKLRFYIDNQVEHIEFNLFTLTEEQFKLLWFCLNKDSLIAGAPEKAKKESLVADENVTKQLYKDYSAFKNDLWLNMIKNSPEADQLLLYKKTQKLLDRFLFIFFSEDSGLLPPNSISSMVARWEILQEQDAYKPLYDIFKQFFSYINTGKKGKTNQDDIFAYNGGLFLPDDILENISIDDAVIHPHVMKLTAYNFESDVNVNILGHIFENSLNEIENVRARLEGIDVDKKQTKRKKDGVYYTPKYITKYIVDNTVGKLCEEKKVELGIDESEYAKGSVGRQKRTRQKLYDNLNNYRDWLLTLTICDPACGSGAFLNQALEFLIAEHAYTDELEIKLFGEGIPFRYVTDKILENNLFGVDINEESVEIAKLSLWLRTAEKGRKLTSLNNNIKCGNSLVDDPKIAGDLAFNWEKSFPDVFAKGGFDVVITNPPYVRADSPGNLLPFRKYMVSCGKYQTLKGKWDLYIPFIELSIQLLTSKGLLSLIIPDAYCHADYSTQSLKYFMDNSMLEMIDYYPNIEVFSNIGVKSVIVTLNKGKVDSSFICKIHSADSSYSEMRLDKYPKSFRLDFSPSLIENVTAGVSISEVLYISKGIVGNSDEKKYKGEFKVGDLLSDIFNDNHSKLYYEGKNINKWGLENERWIEYGTERSPSKWSRKGFPEFFDAEKLVVMRSPGKIPRAFLDNEKGIFNESAIGFVRWVDLKGVKNRSLSKSFVNEEERLSFEKISSNFEVHYLLGIMNSKLIRYELNSNRRSNIHIYPDDWRKISIVSTSLEIRKKIVEKVETIINCTSNFKKHRFIFCSYLRSQFQKKDLSKKLQSWYELEPDIFLKELNYIIKKEGGNKISKIDEMEWIEVLEVKKSEAKVLQEEIDRAEKEIDQIVYKLYELTEEEIKIVESE